MKKISFTLLLTAVMFIANAQTEKGDWMVGGRLDLNTGDASTHIGLTPDAGYFFANNFAVGGNLGIIYDKAGTLKETRFNIGPFVRYYFTHAKVRPLLEGSVAYVHAKFTDSGVKLSQDGTNLFLGGGAAVFMNENVALELLMGYSRTKYSGFDGDGGFNLGIGFQVYLTKRQVERLRGR